MPDCNPLDYYFWDHVQEKIFDGCYYPFAMIDELKGRIHDIWDEYVTDLRKIRKAIKQFLHCFKAVDAKEGSSKNCFWIDIKEEIYLLNTL